MKNHKETNPHTNLLSRREVLWLMSACAATPVLSGCAVNPVTGKSQFMLMSEQQEIGIDRQHAPHQFSGDYGIVQDPALNSYLSDVGIQLAALSHRPGMPYSFQAVNANYINAYAFPGGSVGITRGILVNLNNEAELAALLGHEIGHVTARHTATRMTKGTLLQLALSGTEAALGKAGASAAAIAQQVGQLGGAALLAHYSRDDERQADALGMQYMVAANYNPHGMVGLMTLLRSLSNNQPSALEMMFSTHPMSDERYQRAAHVADSQYASARNMPANQQRYMDNTAKLRQIKPAITAFEQGERLVSQSKFAEAEQRLQAGLKIAPNDYSGRVILAKAKLQQEQYSQAETELQRAIRVYPNEAQAQLLMGVAMLAQNKADGALSHFSQYDNLLPGNPSVQFFKGICQEKMQNRPAAAEHFSAFLQKVNQGEQAQYAYQRLVDWGYVRPAQQ